MVFETKEEELLVQEFKKKIEPSISKYESDTNGKIPDELISDIRLLRFVRGFDSNLEEAKRVYDNMLSWRVEMKVDDMKKEHSMDELCASKLPHWEDLKNVGYFPPFYFAGIGLEGDLVHLEVLGKSNPSTLLDNVSEDKILEHNIGFWEARASVLDRHSVEKGELLKTIQVRDLSYFGLGLLSHARTMSVVQRIMKNGTHNYPESCRKVIFVNTPLSFYGVWKVVSVVLRKKTLEKVVFLQDDYHKALLEYIHPTTIHRLEKMVSSDTTSADVVEGKEEIDDQKPFTIDHQKITIPSGKKKYFPVYITKHGKRSKLKFDIQLIDEPKMNVQQVSSAVFISSKIDDIPITLDFETNQLTFPADCGKETGYLLLYFDNTSSWIMGLNVDINIEFIGE